MQNNSFELPDLNISYMMNMVNIAHKHYSQLSGA